MDNLNSIINATVNRQSRVDRGMALSLESDTVKDSQGKQGLTIGSQIGEGNSSCGLAAGMAVHIFAEDGAVGTRRSVVELFKHLGLDWEYITQMIPSTLPGFEAIPGTPNLVALYRSTDGQLMDTVSDGFSLDLSPLAIAKVWDEVLEKVREVTGNPDIYADRILEMNHKREHMLQTVTGVYETPRGKLQGRITLQTGYSGTAAHKGCISPIAAICQNTYRAALADAVSVRHSANAADRLKDAVLAMVSGEKQIQDLVRWQEKADSVRITKDQLRQAAMAMFPSKHTRILADGTVTEDKETGQSAAKREALTNAFEDPYHGAEGRSLLDLAQGITYVTSHWDTCVTTRRRKGAEPMDNTESLYRGSAGQALDNAYTFLEVISTQNDLDASWMGLTQI